MNNKEVLLLMRSNGNLKGRRPFIVTIYPNFGLMYPHKKKGNYVVSIKDKTIYFQYLSRFFKMLDSTKDFNISTDDLKSFSIEEKYSGIILHINLYGKKDTFLPLKITASGKDGYNNRVNCDYLLSELRKYNVLLEK